MKSKFLFGLVALMVVLAAAQSSFAQVTISLSASPSQNEIATNRNAQAFDPLSAGSGLTVSGVVLANAAVTATGLLLDYPGVITAAAISPPLFPQGLPAGDPIRIEGQTGLFAGAVISSINYSTGVIEVTLPGGFTAGTGTFTSGTFRLLGVRLDANGLTAPAQVSASLTNSANNYQLGSPSTVTVINALSAGMTAPAIGTRSSGTASIGNGVVVFSNRTVPSFTGTAVNGVSFILSEGFESAWRNKNQESTFGGVSPSSPAVIPSGITNGTSIRLTFTGLQTGMTLNLSPVNGGALSVTSTNNTITAAANTTVIDFASTDLTAKEILQINGTLAAPSTTGSPFTTGPIQVTATFYPINPALTGSLIPFSTTYPNFAQADLGPLTIGTVVNPTTTLLIPYAVADLGFDTGIAIANTTADPFGGAVNGGATAGAGPVTISLYGRTATGATPTVVTINTSATVRPGSGLDASGNLNSGSTWTVLLSELRSSAGQTGSFTGYIFIQVPFLDGHGASFISDFRSFTSASPVLVVPPPLSTSRSGQGVESLNN